jgi:hypothetical protein
VEFINEKSMGKKKAHYNRGGNLMRLAFDMKAGLLRGAKA